MSAVERVSSLKMQKVCPLADVVIVYSTTGIGKRKLGVVDLNNKRPLLGNPMSIQLKEEKRKSTHWVPYRPYPLP